MTRMQERGNKETRKTRERKEGTGNRTGVLWEW